MPRTPATVEQPLRRSSRLSGSSPLPTEINSRRTRRSSTESNTAAGRKTPITRRLSLDQDNLANGKMQSAGSPLKRITRRSSITVNGADDKLEKTSPEKTVHNNGDNSNRKKSADSALKNGNTPEKHLDSIKESVDEAAESPTNSQTKAKRNGTLNNLSVINEEKNSPSIVIINNIEKCTEDVNHDNVAMEIDTTITEIVVENTPTKNPFVSLISSASPKLNNNSSSPVEKIKTRTSPRRNNVLASSTPTQTDVKKMLFTEEDETSEDSKKLHRKIDNLMVGVVLAEDSDREEDEEEEEERRDRNPFIDDEAEEGEEDSPPDDSNEIHELGEELNSMDDAFTDDESYEADSFINDDKDVDAQLLSGTEYDLSLELKEQEESLKTSRSRIIGLSSSGSDDNDIVIIDRPKKQAKKKRKSRIIRPQDDSSDEETQSDLIQENGTVNVVKIESLEESPKTCSSVIILENIRIDNLSNEGLSEHIQQVVAGVRSDMPDKGEVSLNVTLDYFEDNKKATSSLTFPEEKEKSSNVDDAAAEEVQEGLPTDSKTEQSKKRRKDKRKRTRCKKRTLAAREIEREEPSFSKKQKKNNGVVKEVAVQNNLMRKIKPDASSASIDWLVNTIEKKTTPSKSKVKKIVGENLKKKHDLHKATTTGAKFHVKDFKNMMLYDPERNYRVDTKHVLNKIGIYHC